MFIEEVTKAGVHAGQQRAAPQRKGKRVRLADGKVTVIDGPFTESKELVASYAFFQVKSMDEAIHWTKRFLEVLGQGECELRPIFEPEDFSTEVFTPEERKREEATRERMRKNAARGLASQRAVASRADKLPRRGTLRHRRNVEISM